MKKAKKEIDVEVEIESQPEKPNDYETEHCLRTLLEAEKIKADPKKMEKIRKLAGEQKKAITSIQDLKDLSNERYGSKSEGKDV